jgi:glutamate carboxypeptidase
MSDWELLESWVRGRVPEAVRLLEQMVVINSFTENADGVNRVGDLTADCFAPLGFAAERVPSVNPKYGQHLMLTKTGTSGLSVAMVSHLDTVFPPEEEERNGFRWRVEGDRIYGPGTNDIKGGTVLMWLTLAGLRYAYPGVFDAVEWRLFWNSSEEALGEDFGQRVRERICPDTVAALVFEGEGRAGGDLSLVVARKGRATWRVTVQGRGAHAGGGHWEGANAIVEMGRLVNRIAAMTEYDRGLTFNVGCCRGGTVVNRVPHEAVVEGELRAFSPEVFQTAKAALLGLAGPGEVRSPADQFRCQVRVEVLEESRPWPRNAETDRLFEVWRAAGEELGCRVEPEERGGLSDGNLLWDAVPCLDGLGPWGDHAHCSEWSEDGVKRPEYVQVDTLAPKAVLNAVAVLRLLESAGLRLPPRWTVEAICGFGLDLELEHGVAIDFEMFHHDLGFAIDALVEECGIPGGAVPGPVLDDGLAVDDDPDAVVAERGEPPMASGKR